MRDQVEDIGQRFIRDHLPDQHREFYEQLPFLLIGSIDSRGRPWASIVVGREGFMESPDKLTLRISSRRIDGDPFAANARPGAPVGVLGIQYHTRRRNRLTAKISNVSEDELTLRVVQAFGNCPQYIQAREVELEPGIDQVGEERSSTSFGQLTERARKIVSAADNFYIATYFADDNEKPSGGADVSHRGGKPGFVRIEDDLTLVFPDYSGNNHYNTIGNITLNPLAGLLFIDFDSGDLLYLTCKAEIIWDSEDRRAFTGAERLVRFVVDEGLLIEKALPMQWRFLDYSPVLEMTGSWEEVDAVIAARRAESQYRDYRVARVERESSVISSFYIEPDDDEPLGCHKAGQFLPIEIEPPGADGIIRRTYTISNAPNGEYYRLSIKREPAPSADVPPGVSSNYFQEHVQPGSIIRAYPPRGQFMLVENSVRPIVLISGGVGVTPMISMLEQLCRDSEGCGCTRSVWFIHGAVSGKEHAFGERVRQMAVGWKCLTTHFVYSSPSDDDVEGKDYDSAGRISVGLLKSLLPLDDYDYYFCGPAPFMRSMYDGLREMNVTDERIHYEFFGPGTSLHEDEPETSSSVSVIAKDAEPVTVTFARSQVTAVWDPSKGTLLDLAEAEGLSPLYSCRSGICSTCQTMLKSGDVEYVDPPIAEPEQGSALICCSYPSGKSGELVLDL